MLYVPVFLAGGKSGFMMKIKNCPIIVMPVMLARCALWLLSLLLLLLFSAMPAAANLVSMVCKGQFVVERICGEITETRQGDVSGCVTVDLDGGDVSRVRMGPKLRGLRQWHR